MKMRKILIPFFGTFLLSSCGPSIELSENALECKWDANGYWLDGDILYSGKNTSVMDKYGDTDNPDVYEEYQIMNDEKTVILTEGLLDDGRRISRTIKKVDFTKGEVTVISTDMDFLKGKKWICD